MFSKFIDFLAQAIRLVGDERAHDAVTVRFEKFDDQSPGRVGFKRASSETVKTATFKTAGTRDGRRPGNR